jgi:hypothetical protein
VPRIEALEDRALPSTFTVLNLADSGPGSLRQAVLDADAHPGADVILFAHGLHGTIALTSGELDITTDLTLRGPGANRLTVSGADASRVFGISGSSTHVEIDDLPSPTAGPRAPPSPAPPAMSPWAATYSITGPISSSPM